MEKRQDQDNPRHNADRESENGSIIIYILIAVALFAALSFAVSNINRTGGNDLTSELANLAASELIQYSTTVKNSVRNAQIEGCADTDISFDNTLASGYENTNNPPDHCNIFEADGQNVAWQKPNPKINDGSQWLFMGNIENTDIGDSGEPELAMFLPGLKTSVCRAINEAVNMPSSPLEGVSALTIDKFTGSYNQDETLGSTSSAHAGKRTFCFEESDSGTLYFYNVLISR